MDGSRRLDIISSYFFVVSSKLEIISSCFFVALSKLVLNGSGVCGGMRGGVGVEIFFWVSFRSTSSSFQVHFRSISGPLPVHCRT